MGFGPVDPAVRGHTVVLPRNFPGARPRLTETTRRANGRARGPTPDESFVVPARVTGLGFEWSSPAPSFQGGVRSRRLRQRHAQRLEPVDRGRGAGVAGLD